MLPVLCYAAVATRTSDEPPSGGLPLIRIRDCTRTMRNRESGHEGGFCSVDCDMWKKKGGGLYSVSRLIPLNSCMASPMVLTPNAVWTTFKSSSMAASHM